LAVLAYFSETSTLFSQYDEDFIFLKVVIAVTRIVVDYNYLCQGDYISALVCWLVGLPAGLLKPL